MLSLYFLMTFCALLLATHFRHGTVKYTHLSGNSVRFTVTIATEGYIGGTGFDFVYGDGFSTFLTTPQCIDTSGTFNSITGCSSDTASEKYPEVISATSAWTIFRYIFDYTYSTNGNFLAGIDGCCRIHDIEVGSGNYNLVYVRIDFTKSWSGSTVSSLAPIVQFPLDSPYQVSIPMSDPDNQIVTCRKATFAESGIETNTHYNLTSGCIISATFSSSAYFPGDLFATQIILETSDGKQAGVDFLIELVGTIQNNNTSPICSIISSPTGTNGEFEVQQGDTLNVIVTGTDTEDTTLTTLLVNGPSGSSISPAGTVSSGDNVIFSWLALTSGSFSTTIQFSDSQGLTSECNFAISVISQPVIEQCDINSGEFTYNWDLTFHTAQDGGVQPSITDTITYDTNGGLLLNLEVITNYKINAIKENDYPNEIFGFTYYLGMEPFDSTGRLLSNANYCENRLENEFNSLDFWRYWTYSTIPQNNNTFPGNGTYFMEYPKSNWYLSLYNDIPCDKIVYFRSFTIDELINFCSWEFDSTTDENYIILSGNVYLTAVSPHPPSYNPIIDSQVYLTESLLTHPILIYFTKSASIVQSADVDLFGMNVISTVYDEDNNEFKITVVTYVPRYLMLESIPNVVLTDPNPLLWTTSEADDTYEHCKILDEYRCWQIFDITTTIGNCSGGYDFGNTYTLFGNVDCLNASHTADPLSQCYEFLDATNNATADDIIDIDTQRIDFVEDCAFSSRFVEFTPYLDLYQDNTFSSIRNPQIDPYSSKGDIIFVEVGLEELIANDNFFGLEIISVFVCTADVAPGTVITGCFLDPNVDVALIYDVIHDPLSFTLINSDTTDSIERFSFQLPVIADSIFFLEVILGLTLDANTTVRRRQLLQSTEGRYTKLASTTVSGSIGPSKNGKNTSHGIDLITIVIISASCVVLLLCTAIVFCGFYMKKLLNNAKGNGEITMGSIVYSQQQNNKNGNNDITPHSTQSEIVCTE